MVIAHKASISTEKPPAEQGTSSGALEGYEASKLSTIDFFADLIPLLKQKYANSTSEVPVEANHTGKITDQNLLVENTQSHEGNQKVSPNSVDHKSI